MDNNPYVFCICRFCRRRFGNRCRLDVIGQWDVLRWMRADSLPLPHSSPSVIVQVSITFGHPFRSDPFGPKCVWVDERASCHIALLKWHSACHCGIRIESNNRFDWIEIFPTTRRRSDSTWSLPRQNDYSDWLRFVSVIRWWTDFGRVQSHVRNEYRYLVGQPVVWKNEMLLFITNIARCDELGICFAAFNSARAVNRTKWVELLVSEHLPDVLRNDLWTGNCDCDRYSHPRWHCDKHWFFNASPHTDRYQNISISFPLKQRVENVFICQPFNCHCAGKMAKANHQNLIASSNNRRPKWHFPIRADGKFEMADM